MSERFDPSEADGRWQRVWDERQCFRADDNSPKPRSFVLEMFPYPSGRIHIGHVRNYTMGDVLARYKRMRGFEVLHPMGWDAFGMPAENAAMEKGVHPGGWTRENIANMKAQLKRLGFALDWSRELATCEPDYYGHEQALFLDLYAAGLVYRKESAVNWDPVDMTVLANEQVIDGRGWRSGALVEKRKLSQWFLKITDFAEELLEGLGTLEGWPEKVRTMQENWIGKSQGLRCLFKFPAGSPLPLAGGVGGGPVQANSPTPSPLPQAGGVARTAFRSSPPGPIRFTAQASLQLRRIIRWPSHWLRTRLSCRISSPPASAAARRRLSWKRPKSWASTPASASNIRLSRNGTCRSMSPTSC